jgi:hypothetical protein
MNTENRHDRLGRIRLFFEGLRSWIPTFVGMTLEYYSSDRISGCRTFASAASLADPRNRLLNRASALPEGPE